MCACKRASGPVFGEQERKRARARERRNLPFSWCLFRTRAHHKQQQQRATSNERSSLYAGLSGGALLALEGGIARPSGHLAIRKPPPPPRRCLGGAQAQTPGIVFRALVHYQPVRIQRPSQDGWPLASELVARLVWRSLALGSSAAAALPLPARSKNGPVARGRCGISSAASGRFGGAVGRGREREPSWNGKQAESRRLK